MDVKGVIEDCPLVTVPLALRAMRAETGRTGVRRKRGRREAARRCILGYLRLFIRGMILRLQASHRYPSPQQRELDGVDGDVRMFNRRKAVGSRHAGKAG